MNLKPFKGPCSRKQTYFITASYGLKVLVIEIQQTCVEALLQLVNGLKGPFKGPCSRNTTELRRGF